MILPETEWLMPTEYPDLRSYPEIAIDLETRDPELKSKGSGSVIGVGEIVGVISFLQDTIIKAAIAIIIREFIFFIRVELVKYKQSVALF